MQITAAVSLRTVHVLGTVEAGAGYAVSCILLDNQNQTLNVTMKKTPVSIICRTALATLIGLAGVTQLKADSVGHLLLGITQSGGNSTQNDLYYDLGSVTNIVDGKTWNLNALLTAQGYDLSQIQWGVLGDSLNGDTQFKSPHTGLTWYSDTGLTPRQINGYNTFNSYQTPINTVEQAFFGGVGNAKATNGQSQAIFYSGSGKGYSWYEETISGPLTWWSVTGGANVNVTGLNSPANIWQVTDDNSAPVLLGTLTLNGSGVLTFNAVANTPPAPRIVSITRTNTTTWIYFTTTNTFTYTLYYTNSAGLSTSVSNWPASATTVTGNGSAATNYITDTTTDALRFYRVGVH
jgi:hypothetical protein